MAVLSKIEVRSRADVLRIEAEMTLAQRLPERSVLDVFIGAADDGVGSVGWALPYTRVVVCKPGPDGRAGMPCAAHEIGVITVRSGFTSSRRCR